MHVGETLDRIGERLLIDIRIFCSNPIADCAVGDNRELENS